MSIQDRLYNPRTTTAYGTLRGNQKIYADNVPDLTSYAFATKDAAKIYVYNRQGRRMGELSSESGQALLSNVSFELVENGCGNATVELAEFPSFPLELGYFVAVHLYQDESPWYSGIIMEVPGSGTVYSDGEPVELKVFGFYQLLDKLVIHGSALAPASYRNTSVTTIAYNLATNFVGPRLSVMVNPDKIDTTDYTAQEVNFELATGKKSFEDLSGLAKDYIFGIDASRSFFFRQRRPVALTRGVAFPTHNLEIVSITHDMDNVVNRLYVKGGKLASETAPNLTYIIDDPDSQRIYGVREKVESAPTVVNTADVEQWGNWYIEQYAEPTYSVKARYTDVGTLPLIPGDLVRIHTTIETAYYKDTFVSNIFDPSWTIVNTLGSSIESDPTNPGVCKIFAGSGSSATSFMSNPWLYKRTEGDFKVSSWMNATWTDVDDYVADSGAGLHARESSRRWVEITQKRTDSGTLSASYYIERRDTFDGNTVVTSIGTGATSSVFYMERIDGKVVATWRASVDAVGTEISLSPTIPFSSSKPLRIGPSAFTDGTGTVYGVPTTVYYTFRNVEFYSYARYYDLPVKKVKYAVEGNKISADVELGEFKPPFLAQMNRITSDIRNEQIREDRNVEDLLALIPDYKKRLLGLD
jgi:hypothetical protein